MLESTCERSECIGCMHSLNTGAYQHQHRSTVPTVMNKECLGLLWADVGCFAPPAEPVLGFICFRLDVMHNDINRPPQRHIHLNDVPESIFTCFRGSCGCCASADMAVAPCGDCHTRSCAARHNLRAQLRSLEYHLGDALLAFQILLTRGNTHTPTQ